MKNHIPNSKKNWKIISSITKISFGYHTYTFHWKMGINPFIGNIIFYFGYYAVSKHGLNYQIF